MCALLLAGLAAAVAAPHAGAATLTVTSTSDSFTASDGACSLREAVAANDAPGTPGDCGTASADGNTIVLGPHTYTLSIPAAGADHVDNGDLDVTGSAAPLTIQGGGDGLTVVSAAGLGDRLLDIAGGATVVVRDLELTGGHAPDGADAPQANHGQAGGDGAPGGAIRNAGTLTVADATVTLNSAGKGGAGANGGGVGNGGNGGSGGAGGGIYNTGSLTLDAVTLTLNQAGKGGTGAVGGDSLTPAKTGGTGGCCGDGGGLANNGGSVVIRGSTISSNHAGDGGTGGPGGAEGSAAGGQGGTGAGGSSGGAVASFGGSISITNSTISSNMTGTGGGGGTGGTSTSGAGGTGGGAGYGSAGGGVWVSSGIGALVNVTVYANQVGGPGTPGSGGQGGAGNGAGGAAGQPAFAGGVYDTGSPATSLTGTLLASNQLGNCGGVTLEDGGHNLSFGDASCPMTFMSGDPHLGVLQDNGGPTETVALGPGSSAIDQISASGAGCPTTDQRGVPRPGGAACDIGAYEVAPPSLSVAAATGLTTAAATLNGSVTANAASANAHFDYGPTTAYGSQTATQPIEGTGAVSLSATLADLTPNTTYHYRLVAASTDGTSASSDATFTTTGLPALIGAPPLSAAPRPTITKLKISPTAFLAATATHHRKTGATISYSDSLDAKTMFIVLRATAGVKRGSRCEQKPKHGHGTACILYIKAGSFTHTDKAGTNTLHFTGRVGNTKLTPGRYHLQATPTTATTTGSTVTIGFRVT